jgi:hypothetical protein
MYTHYGSTQCTHITAVHNVHTLQQYTMYTHYGSTTVYTHYGSTQWYVHCNTISSTSSSHSTVMHWFYEKVFSDDDILFGAVCCTVKEVHGDMHVWGLLFCWLLYNILLSNCCFVSAQRTVKGQQPVTSHTAVLTVLTSASHIPHCSSHSTDLSQSRPTLQFSQYWPQTAGCPQAPCLLH